MGNLDTHVNKDTTRTQFALKFLLPKNMNKFKTSLLICILLIVITEMINARRLINSSGATSRFPRKERRISPVLTKPTFLIRSPYKPRQRSNSNQGFKKKSILHQSLPSYHQGNRYGTRKEFVVESPTLVLIRREVIEAY